jgi:CheY-like chemotaxis protein
VRVLIVEDDENKRLQVVSYLREEFDGVDVVERRSYQSGLKEILDTSYDAILLDMTMPTYDKSFTEPGGRPRPFAGKDILTQMSHRKMSTPVIVVTGFETFGEGNSAIALGELKRQLQTQFPALYKGTVYYNVSQSQWKYDLKSALQTLKK